MKLKWIMPAALLCIAAVGTNAQAGDIAVGIKASTLGISGEVVTNVVPMLLNARLQLNGFNYNKTITDTTVRYDAALKLRSAGILADLYPFAGKFRISAGLYYNGNKFNVTGVPSVAQNFTINNTVYNTANIGSVNGTVDFNKFAPYLGIGWGDSVSAGSPLGFSFELGALYQGKPKTTLTTSKSLANPTAQALLGSNIAAEKKKLDDSLNNFKFYPVISLGINYKF
ncbi:hypothetical protein JYT48_01545 [Mariprofundus ferrooxydans]|nr:hypothetical protein [Mariprofundus ferrooxydans]